MNFKTLALAAITITTFSATAALAGTTYRCDVKQNGVDGGISPLLMISVNDDETKAMVYDARIKHYHGEPIDATIVVANSKRYTLKWTVVTVNDSYGNLMPRIRYRATYLKQSHKISITGFPAGGDNQFNGSGSCKQVK